MCKIPNVALAHQRSAPSSMSAWGFSNGTNLIIKKDGSADIVKFMSDDGIKKVLLLTGKTAVKKIGLYDTIVNALKQANIDFVACDEVRANPEISTVVKCIDLCRDNGVEAILGVGGGSVFDAAKGIAVGAKFPRSQAAATVWDFYEGKGIPTSALPFYGVLTISATGSESDNGSVVQDDKQLKKWFFQAPCTFPKVSIVDPDLQKHLPWYQQVNGFVDAMMHVLEYLTVSDDFEAHALTYDINVAIIRQIIRSGDALQKNPEDYYARANFCWAAAAALNGITAVSYDSMCCAVHMMEQAISAVDPTVSHGAGLGVVFPAFVKVNTKHGLRQKTYARLAKDLFGKEDAQGLIEGYQAMLKRWGHPTTLDELLGKKVTETERKHFCDVFMKRPICGFYKDGQLPSDIAWETYQTM